MAEAGTKAEVNRIWQRDVIPNLPPEDKFTIMKRFEIFTREAHDAALAGEVVRNFYDVAQKIQEFRITGGIARRVRAPVLVTSYEGDAFFIGQPQQLYGLLGEPKKLVNFTAADGTHSHDAPMAPQRRNEVVSTGSTKLLGSDPSAGHRRRV